jgi:hypothetical protein
MRLCTQSWKTSFFTCRLLIASLHRELRSLSTHMHSADCAVTQKVRATITPLHREQRATLFTGRALNMSLNRELKSIANRMQSADRVTCRTLIAPLHRELKSISVFRRSSICRPSGRMHHVYGSYGLAGPICLMHYNMHQMGLQAEHMKARYASGTIILP